MIRNSKVKYLQLCSLLLIGFIMSQHGFAQSKTVYISDVLYVPLRSGASIEYRIINAAMKSGTKMARLEQSEDGLWSKVRTDEDLEGWIRNQYLVEEMTSELKLNQSLTRMARLEKTNQTLTKDNSKLKNENAKLSSQLSSTSNSKSQLTKEYDSLRKLSAGAVELERNYQELLKKHEVTQTQRDSLMAENEQLRNNRNLSFLLYGAGILVLGMILAVVVPALKPKKGYSEWG
ncbi:MAG: TIGR04211 family SH3 domain-containing protein [Agarilytica sp.]